MNLTARTGQLVALAASGQLDIANLATRLEPLSTSMGDLPLTINDGAPTCYICSPSVAYHDYALAELRHFTRNPALLAILRALLAATRPLLALSGLDRQVQLNNWLISTNPAPALEAPELAALVAALVRRFPRHAIVCRSLNDVSDAETLAAFTEAGFALLPARQIYLFDARRHPPSPHRDEVQDEKLFARTSLQLIGPADFTPADYPQMATLYRQLYIDKYTPLNPQYGPGFMQHAHETGLIAFHGLRQQGRLVGLVGFFDIGSTMTSPIVGYDTGLPQALGLYRFLTLIGLRRARSRHMLFNLSAGAAGFKRSRGARPAIEYMAVYARHLPPPQRAAIATMRLLLNGIGPPLLRRYAL